MIDEVNCDSNDVRLVDCNYTRSEDRSEDSYCNYQASVRCSTERLSVQNISATINATTHTVLISWGLYSDLPHKHRSFSVWCYNHQREIEFSLWMNNINGTLTRISVGNLLSTSLDCCMSAIYDGNYQSGQRCTSTDSDMSLSDLFTTPTPNHQQFTTVTPTSIPETDVNSSMMMPALVESESKLNVISDTNTKAIIIGGVLGSIIIILLLLLALCGGTLLYLLCSRDMISKM